MSRGLDGLWVSGLDVARDALAQRALLFVANHVAWWDALLLLPLDEALGGTGWAMMDSRQPWWPRIRVLFPYTTFV